MRCDRNQYAGIVFSALYLSVFVDSTSVAAGAGKAKSLASPAYHYILVMSEDDDLCKPLTALYNKLLRAVPGQLEQAARGIPIPDLQFTNFETSEPAKFASIGLTLPPLVASVDHDPSVGDLYYVDVFNDGTPRYVNVWNGPVTAGGIQAGAIQVLKKGAEYAEVPVSSLNSPYVKINQVDPELVDPAGDLPLENIQIQGKTHPAGYKLKKWPGYHKYKIANIHEYTTGFPAISGGFTKKLFLFGSKVIFVINRYDSIDTVINNNETDKMINYGLILVYKLKHSGPDDLCYIALDPTPLTETLRESK
jgi:hypothetical protein